ncbi:TraG/VirB4 family ATPase [Ramlibacter alkalitolerans]|uniref:Transporter n=1 Tax=Ramlibacter alkalitolerans TaxID=2039631 RepID=A0ABS1JUH2_9BURK|nr:transporter [Ramlibacter alkalitolerans]MBL0427781.1 transporter [Ramlibacter alkalitolerans]
MLSLKEFRPKAVGFPDLLNWAAFVDEGVLMGKDGSFMTCATFAGPDLASSTEAGLESLAAQVNQALARLDHGWSIHADVARRPAKGYPSSTFPEAVTTLIDRERRESYMERDAQFENDFVLTLCYQPPVSKTSFMFKLLESKDESTPDETDHTRELVKFKQGTDEFFRLMAGGGWVDIAPMSCQDMLRFLYLTIRGEFAPLKMPYIPMYLDALLGAHDFVGGNEPRLGDKHIRVVSIQGLPALSTPGMLDVLAGVPCIYRWNTRFVAMDKGAAVKELQSYRKRFWGQRLGVRGHVSGGTGVSPVFEDGNAASLAADADAAVNEASAGDVKFGYYTSSVVLMDTDKKRVMEAARAIQKKIEENVGFVAGIETVNTIEAFLGSLPGHRVQNVRRPLLHTYNLADLLPLTRVYPGEAHNSSPFFPKQSPALLMAETTGSTPFRFNLHVGDLGHTTVLGPTGAGKSTLLGLIAAQFFRYPRAQVFFFDKGYSALPLCRASGGVHYDILGENSDLTFYPLRQLETVQDIAWACDWVETLVTLQGMTVGVSQRKTIKDAIDLLASDADDRTLQALQAKMMDRELGDALAPYVQGGQLNTLLDSDKDSLADARFQVFELEHLMSMGERGDKWVVPVLLYLFRQIEKRLDGRPTILVLDEAWLLLDHPLFQAKIKEWLKVLRKANCAVIFATQSISDVMSSRIKDVILESCPTKILLPNREAKNEYSRKMYEQLGLNETEIDIIATATPKAHYYVTSPLGKRLIGLGLRPLTLAFIGASGKDDLATIRSLIRQHGDEPANWVPYWLRHRGLHDWAERFQDEVNKAPA